MKKYFDLFCFVSLLIFLQNAAFARKFYFSTAGNDSYTVLQAQNPSTPWMTLIQLENAYRNLNAFTAGDTICFKRGDVFVSGRDQFGSMKWWNDGTTYFNAPSGTITKPIVFTNYGDINLALPNFLFPNPGTSVTANHSRHCLSFEGVEYLIFDGLQFNDYRFPYTDKVTAAYTTSGLHLGERPSGFPSNQDVKHIVVKNCNFSNIGYGIMSSGSYIQISNNRFTNFKSVGDTSGVSIFSDIGSDPIQPSGDHYLIDHNYMKGGWSYSSPFATGQGKVGGAIEVINDFDSSKIVFNTFIDCEGVYEFGRNIANDTLLGPNDDTTAYNLIINCGKIAYVHTGTSQFSTRAARLRFWNNLYIENNFSRFSGPNFGKDIYGDGQSFQQFPGWSQGYPKNPSDSNYGGHRVIQYSSETVKGNPDTLIDSRNNIFWNTTGLQQIYDITRTKYIHANNIYHLVNNYRFPSSIGGVLNTINNLETISTSKIITDTADINPELWNYNVLSGSIAINFGRNVGISKDYAGTLISGNPDAGIYEYSNNLLGNLTLAITADSILCNGSSSTVTVTATGGTAPYTGTGTFNVIAGSYTYTVTDAVGSVKTTTITITQPTAITPTVTSGRIIIYGGTTTITTTATGGTGAYSYKLNRGVYQTSNVFSSVPAGVDTVYIKDANSCVASRIITITQPASLLAITATPTTILCNGATSNVTVTATGGTPPYTGTGSFTVIAGTYTYSIADSNAVTVSTSVNISQPTLITATVTPGVIAVYGAKTTITLSSVSGGLSPYSYALNNGVYQTSTTFSNVPAGVHSISIKDARGCVVLKSITITQPLTTLACASTSTNILCNGSSSTVTVTATGGTAPYTGTGTFNVIAGSYTYTVTDAVGSVKTTTITITQPTAITPTVTSGRIIIYGGTTTITTTATGGTGAYSYKLNRGVYQTSNVFSSVPAGVDTVYIKDANSCVVSRTITITQPSRLILIANPTSILCNNGTATITISAMGGTPPYTGTGTYVVTAGTYNYSIADSNNITEITTVTVTQPAVIAATVTPLTSNISTYGGTTSINITNITGGISPYTYSINNGLFQTLSTFTNVRGGNHVVNIRDNNGCILSKNITIKQPLQIIITESINVICQGQNTGSITVTADGGTPPYRFRYGILNVSTGTYTGYVSSAIYSNLAAGIYVVKVKDSLNASSSVNDTILPGILCAKGANYLSTTDSNKIIVEHQETYSVYPNPTNNQFTIRLSKKNFNKFYISVYNSNGEKVMEKFDYSNDILFGKELLPGIYYLRLCINGVITTKKIVKTN